MSVIFSRAPLRISLGGGGHGSSLLLQPDHGGFLVSGAIDKYVYMLMHTVFQQRYRMKYSEMEEVDEISEIRHPILRETLLRHWRGNPLEIASVADVPAGTGMGSSGAYTVCLLKGLAHARRTSITPGALAEAACEIEIDVLGEPVGKQDPYVAAHGGICAYTFDRDGGVEVEPLELGPEALRRLRDQLLLFYTGEARSASKVLADQDQRSKAGDEEMLENLHRTKELGRRSCELLQSGDLDKLRGADARALGTQAAALAGHGERAHRPPLHARPAQRRHRRQARRSRGRRIPARVRPATGGHAPGDGRRGRIRACVRLRVRGRVRERVHMSGLRVAIVGCGLIGSKRAAALGAE